MEWLSAALAPMAQDTASIMRTDGEISLQRFVDAADLLKQMQFTKAAAQTGSR